MRETVLFGIPLPRKEGRASTVVAPFCGEEIENEADTTPDGVGIVSEAVSEASLFAFVLFV